MAKRPSLYHQLLTELKALIRFGESKHRAKQIEIERAHARGETGFGVAPRGIYSVKTYISYRQTCYEFARWAKDPGARTMEEAYDLVPEYIKSRIEKGYSPWTVRKDRSALRKVFKDKTLAAEVKIPRRRLDEIKRSRHPVKMDKHFSPEQNRDLVDFAKATGLRRHELEAVTKADVYEQDGQIYVYVRQGKGGKPRTVHVLSEMVERVREIVKRSPDDGPLFPNVTKTMDVHSYRREYAQQRVLEADESEVTKDLGHNRVDVLRMHYLRRRTDL